MTNLKRELDKRGLRHSHVAKLSGVSSGEFSGFVTGRLRPGIEIAKKVAQVLEVDYLTLWPELDDNHPRVTAATEK